MGFKQSPFPMINGTTGHKKELTSPAKISYPSTSQFPGDYHPKWNPSGSKSPKVSKKPASLLRRTIKAFGNTPKQFIKKAGKILGGKTLGVAGMMTAKSATATQPGTGTHGGKKQTKYNPKTGKYDSATPYKPSPAKGYKKKHAAWAASQSSGGKSTLADHSSAEKGFGPAGKSTHIIGVPK